MTFAEVYTGELRDNLVHPLVDINENIPKVANRLFIKCSMPFTFIVRNGGEMDVRSGVCYDSGDVSMLSLHDLRVRGSGNYILEVYV